MWFSRQGAFQIIDKIPQINWLLILLLGAISSVGFAMLYSASNGNLDPWAMRQMVRFAIGVGLMIFVALIDIRYLLRYAYVAYFVGLALLIVTEIAGAIGMGAQRWIDVGVFQIQPSEIMKVTLVLALARYFHGLTPEEIRKPTVIFFPAFLVGVPALAGAEAARSRHRAHSGAGRRDHVFPRRHPDVEIRARLRGGGRHRAHRLEFPARLPEAPHRDLSRSRIRSPGLRLSHHAVEDRAWLRRRVRQGLLGRQPEPSQFPARESRPISSSPCWPKNSA